MNTTPRPLSDFFTVAVAYDEKNQPAPRYMSVGPNEWGGKPYRVPVGPYCSIHIAGGPWVRSLGVVPSDETMSEIEARMLALEDDVIWFDLIRPHGAADFTLYAKYNLILGSRIIGYVRADTIPQNK